MPEKIEIDTWKAYTEHVHKTLVPQLTETEVVVGLYTGKADVKMATEIGYALLIGKPIIVLAADGAEVPDGLRKAAYAVVVGDPTDDETRLEFAAVLDELLTAVQNGEEV